MSVEEGETFDVEASDFAIAFALEHYVDGVKDDPRFVQWLVKYSFADEEGNYSAINFPMHRCTPEYMERFNPPDNSSREKIEKYKKEGGLFCFELPPEASEVYGYWQSGANYAALDIMAAPCGY